MKKTGIGLRIEKHRKAKEITQEKLAELMFMDVNSIRSSENGVRELRANEIIRISEIFGITTDELLLGQKPDGVLHGKAAYVIREFLKDDPGSVKADTLNYALSITEMLELIVHIAKVQRDGM